MWLFYSLAYRTEFAINKRHCLEGTDAGEGLPHFCVPSWFWSGGGDYLANLALSPAALGSASISTKGREWDFCLRAQCGKLTLQWKGGVGR